MTTPTLRWARMLAQLTINKQRNKGLEEEEEGDSYPHGRRHAGVEAELVDASSGTIAGHRRHDSGDGEEEEEAAGPYGPAPVNTWSEGWQWIKTVHP